jgi:CheY-like chemotaxis protein
MPRILIAEDNPALANVLRFNLQRAGFEVVAAGNGREALELAERQPFDLIVSDQNMPEMTGLELCAELRRRDTYKHIPVILVTAKGMELDAAQLQRELGIASVFSKPFSPSKVVRAVSELLGVAVGD